MRDLPGHATPPYCLLIADEAVALDYLALSYREQGRYVERYRLVGDQQAAALSPPRRGLCKWPLRPLSHRVLHKT